MSFLLNLSRLQKRAILFGIDVLLVPVAVLATGLLQFGRHGVWDWFIGNWAFAILLMTVAALCSVGLGTFRVRLKSFDRSAIGIILIGSGLVGLASLVLSKFGGLDVPLRLHLTLSIAYFLLVCGSRFLMLEILLKAYRLNRKVSSVIIYGAGKTGMQLASALKSYPDIMPVGFVDDSHALSGQIIGGLPVFHGARLEEVVKETRPDRVVIAMPSASRQAVAKIERRLEQTGVEFQILPSFAQLIGQEQTKGHSSVAHDVFLGRRDHCDAIDIGRSEYEGRVVMVSGAGGSIGSELCRQILRCAPSELILFEQSELALYEIEMELQGIADRCGCMLTTVLGSVTNAQVVQDLLAHHKVEVIFHAAAYKHVPMVQKNPLAGLSNNVLGTATLATAARDAKVKRFVLVSTDKAVRPKNIMGASKRFAEMVIQDLASRSETTVFSTVRFGNVLGSSGSVVPLFQDQVARGGPVTLTDNDVTRYFMTVQEAARLVLTAGSLSEGGEVFVLDMGKPVRVRELAEQVIEAAGYTVRNEENPDGDIDIVTIGLRSGEKLHEELTITRGRTTTKHEKIFSVREDCLSELELASALKQLREAVALNDTQGGLGVVSRWIDGSSPPVKNVR